jgi:hypothetical protein
VFRMNKRNWFWNQFRSLSLNFAPIGTA